jgi:hypothetical protein
VKINKFVQKALNFKFKVVSGNNGDPTAISF